MHMSVLHVVLMFASLLKNSIIRPSASAHLLTCIRDASRSSNHQLLPEIGRLPMAGGEWHKQGHNDHDAEHTTEARHDASIYSVEGVRKDEV